MQGLDPFDDGNDGTVFRDVIMLALLGFVTIVILLLPHLNPPVQASDAPPPGNVIVEVRWPDNLNTDVDLWVQGPGDGPVGYSNKGGRTFDLLRDDLGHANDATGLNYEIAFSRGTPVGEYTVNLHLYRDVSGRLPIPAVVVVSVRPHRDVAAAAIATEQVTLDHVGQELTVVRFVLDEKGALVAGSVHQLPRVLRTAAAAIPRGGR